MKKWNLIRTKNLNNYVYSEKYKLFSYMPDAGFAALMGNQVKEEKNNYYIQKYNFLKEKGFFDTIPIEFETQYDPQKIHFNISNLRQLLVEVTDCCNLQCTYCGYGEYYNNYDKRETRQQKFSTVKAVIDQFALVWNSEANTSYNKIIRIGFYGGEPLMNFSLIKKIVEYVETLDISGMTFAYNMTTNGLLLHRYMDFIAKKNFSLLISLDGDEFNSSYRVDKKGENRFRVIIQNAHLLKNKYPEYFKENVNFNSVLHDRNSAAESYRFIKEQFDKAPRVAQLNVNGVDEEKREDFMRMFNSKPESVKDAEVNNKMKDDDGFIKSETFAFHSFLQNYVGHDYKSFNDLYSIDTQHRFIPTGTCQPFERKIFLTVNGKLLPCEKVGHQHSLGCVADGVLNLDYETIADYYGCLYEKIVGLCQNCLSATTCGQCIFNLVKKNGEIDCPYYASKDKTNTLIEDSLDYAENNPEKYAEIMNKMIVD